MRPKQGIRDRVTVGGRWQPPKAHGNNRRYPSTHFYHDRERTAVVDFIPATALLYKTFSVYHDHAVIWSVDYDATSRAVHDGRETSAADGELEVEIPDNVELQDDWKKITFSHTENYVSYVGRRLDQSRLCMHRPDQPWAQQILPDSYTSRHPRQSYGGMNGELPLLIGLMALAIPEDDVREHLPQATGNPWRAPNFERAAGCEFEPSPCWHSSGH